MAIEVNRSYHGPELLAQEVVERKGPGHPDTLVDGIAEFFSRRSVLASIKERFINIIRGIIA